MAYWVQRVNSEPSPPGTVLEGPPLALLTSPHHQSIFAELYLPHWSTCLWAMSTYNPVGPGSAPPSSSPAIFCTCSQLSASGTQRGWHGFWEGQAITPTPHTARATDRLRWDRRACMAQCLASEAPNAFLRDAFPAKAPLVLAGERPSSPVRAEVC